MNDRMSEGFTLIEMVVVVAIIALMSGLILTRIPALRSQTAVNASVDTLLQTARDARLKSSTVEQLEATGDFPAYGVYFDLSTPQQIVIYADCTIDDNKDGSLNQLDKFYYQASECGGSSVKKTTLLQAFTKISAIRTVSTSGSISDTKAYMEYVRPDPTIWLSDVNAVNAANPNLLPYGHIEIDVSDMNGKFTKTIEFWTSGKVAVR